MKDQIWKWIKRYAVTIWLVAAVIGLVAAGTYAAYVNCDIVERVVSLGKENRTYFSSNYLFLMDKIETDYTTRRLSGTPVKEGDTVTGYNFTVQVCNYLYGNEELVNPKKIDYQLKASWKGDKIPDNVTGIKVNNESFDTGGTLSLNQATLPANQATKQEYTFFVPAALKDTAQLEIVVEPTDASSYSATNQQKLAAVITLAEQTPNHTWTGHFIDDPTYQNQVSDYEGFNYEISGSGKGTVTLTWDSKLTISPWFVGDVKGSDPTLTDGKYTCTFAVDSDTTSAYQLQFDRADNEAFDALSWDDLETWVTVTFTAE